MHGLRATAILVFAGATMPAFAEQITCESHQGGVEACTTVLPGSQVKLVTQLGETPCVEGKSWGLDPKLNSLWTSGGCRAVFDVKPSRDDPNAKRHEVLLP